jgi:NADH-quinone oxidoreductase subunit C
VSDEHDVPRGALSVDAELVRDGERQGLRQKDSPTWGEPDVDAVERMVAALGADVVEGLRVHRDELTVVVAREYLREVLTYLRDHEGYDFLSDVTAVDYLGYEGELAGYWGGAGRDLNRAGSWGKDHVPEAPAKRFGISVHVAKVMTVENGGHRRLRVQVFADDGERVPSLVPVYPSADYHEREAYDMFGIEFDGHPNLVRILMPDDWGGHPQRKDYPLGGEPVQFSDEV